MAGTLAWPEGGPPEGTRERTLWRAGLVVDLVGDEIDDDETRFGDVLIDLIQWSIEHRIDFAEACESAVLDAEYERKDWP